MAFHLLFSVTKCFAESKKAADAAPCYPLISSVISIDFATTSSRRSVIPVMYSHPIKASKPVASLYSVGVAPRGCAVFVLFRARLTITSSSSVRNPSDISFLTQAAWLFAFTKLTARSLISDVFVCAPSMACFLI